ncbi:MAG TPA: hypothetical protein VGJ63_08810 [Micromonosporaceae bacterium]|jgi:hypothetical protein
MRLPDEDLGPVWLRDWQQIEADIAAMADFARQLRAEVEVNYAPHASRVTDELTTPLPGPPEPFTELVELLTVHRAAEQDTANIVYYYTDKTGGLADAAAQISHQYRNTDAFAAARVSDVEAALRTHGVNQSATTAAEPAPTSTPPSTTSPSTGAF